MRFSGFPALLLTLAVFHDRLASYHRGAGFARCLAEVRHACQLQDWGQIAMHLMNPSVWYLAANRHSADNRQAQHNASASHLVNRTFEGFVPTCRGCCMSLLLTASPDPARRLYSYRWLRLVYIYVPRSGYREAEDEEEEEEEEEEEQEEEEEEEEEEKMSSGGGRTILYD
eukprot:jgi/Botrbrau1/18100/Bobra.0687s0002.1